MSVCLLPMIQRLARRDILAVIILLVSLIAGCQRYGDVSPEAYGYAKALYSACNRRDEDGLSDLKRSIEDVSTAGKLNEREANWLLEIISAAESGDWENATRDSRQLMEDKVKGR